MSEADTLKSGEEMQIIQTTENQFSISHNGVEVIKEASHSDLMSLARALAPFIGIAICVIVQYDPFEVDEYWDSAVPLRYEASFHFPNEEALESIMENVEEDWYDHRVPKSAVGMVSLSTEFLPGPQELPEGTTENIVEFLKAAYKPIIGSG